MNPPPKTILRVAPDHKGRRLDAWLAENRREYSRSRWQDLIRHGHVLVDGRIRPAHYILKGSETILVSPPPPPPETALTPEDIPLEILYQDRAIVVVNKPAGLVVHPAPGNPTGTLVNALLYHCPDIQAVKGELRPGIVHRLDKNTSGVMVAAKNEKAMAALAAQFKARTVSKEYLALVRGTPRPPSGTVSTLIGRSAADRKKMSARPPRGRPAITHYRTVEVFRQCSLLRISIATGRTHQIRVHMAHIGHPVIGDSRYGRAGNIPLPLKPARQMLHAESIAFTHPINGSKMRFRAPLPPDMRQLLELLRDPEKQL